MIGNRPLNSVVLSLIAFTLALTVACPRADAQVKPFAIAGITVGTKGIPVTPNVPAPHWSVGVATELGEYYGAGNFQVLDFVNADPTKGPLTDRLIF